MKYMCMPWTQNTELASNDLMAVVSAKVIYELSQCIGYCTYLTHFRFQCAILCDVKFVWVCSKFWVVIILVK